MDLNTVWFLLISVLITGYALLDGFDLGVGILHLFSRDDRERRIHLNAIGPVWDGNEVWLLTAGGAMFAAFPIVYATVFSGFYLAFMLLLLALIFRAVSLEFRHQVDHPTWRRVWDWGFGLGSLVPALLYGVAVGNVLRGLPILQDGSLRISLLGLLNPYSLLLGILGLVMFIMHGATYLALKSDGALLERSNRAARGSWIGFVILYALSTLATYLTAPYLFEGVMGNPLTWLFFLLLLASIIILPLALRATRQAWTFLASGGCIVGVIGLAGVSLYRRLVPSSIDLAYSLTIYNASSTPRTLSTMLIIALIGMPIVIGYSIYIYRTFRGKVVLTEDSY
jgi:cytochrome d ubiquinol oxidase subunit II